MRIRAFLIARTRTEQLCFGFFVQSVFMGILKIKEHLVIFLLIKI